MGRERSRKKAGTPEDSGPSAGIALEASFHVSIKDWMVGRGNSGEVRADYEIRRGGRVETYEIRDGRVRLVEE